MVMLGYKAAWSTQFTGSIPRREDDMPESVYDVIQLIGTSKESWEKAAANAVEQASKSLRDLRIAEIVELDMQLDAKGQVEAYRAKVKVSFSRALKSLRAAACASTQAADPPTGGMAADIIEFIETVCFVPG